MRKLHLIAFLFIILICGCSSQNIQSSSERSDIVEWAKQIAKYEKDAELVVNDFQKLTSDLVSRYPTNNELDKLTTYYNVINAMYNELSELEPPLKATSVHKKYVDNYSKVSDSILNYIIAVKQNDIIYFEKSVSASKEANQIGENAYREFIELLDDYSISCNEIDYCE